MIRFNDIQASNARFSTAFADKLAQVLERGQTILGPEVSAFEAAFADYCGTTECIGVANGLDALVLIFRAYIELGKLKSGDEIIVPTNTYIASILAVNQAGLVPVLVEPDPETLNIGPENIGGKLSTKTKGILAVHLYGRLCPMDALSDICRKNMLLLIEDAAQAHGASQIFQGQTTKAGNLSDAAAFSFYPTKNLGALGDGGAVTTNDSELARTIRMLRNYGTEKRYISKIKGVNSRLDELQAAFLNVKLPFLDPDNQHRIKLATLYKQGISNPKIIVPDLGNPGSHVFHLFVILCHERDRLAEYLLENGVETIIHYPVPPHKQDAYPEWHALSFPVTEGIHERILSLPIGACMDEVLVGKVVELVNSF